MKLVAGRSQAFFAFKEVFFTPAVVHGQQVAGPSRTHNAQYKARRDGGSLATTRPS
jgi:hypothetical protein